MPKLTDVPTMHDLYVDRHDHKISKLNLDSNGDNEKYNQSQGW